MKNKYVFPLVIISIMVAFLIHFPELASLFDVTGQSALSPDMSVSDVANGVFLTFMSLLLLLAMNTYVSGFNRQKARISWQKALLPFIMTWRVNNLSGKGLAFLHHQLDIPATDALVHYYLYPLRDFIISYVVTGGCYMICLIHRSQQVQVENQQLRTENLSNQYEALRSQPNPHMLLNSLNTLHSLVQETPGKAQEYLQELSHVLHYTLQENEHRSVTLREKMDFVSAYISLSKMRYRDNLVPDMDLGKERESKQLPPMSVQLLIESAVEHNEISNRHLLTISVRSGRGSLTVNNPIQSELTHSGDTGIDLVNLSKRYNLLYKKDISIREDASIFSATVPSV